MVVVEGVAVVEAIVVDVVVFGIVVFELFVTIGTVIPTNRPTRITKKKSN